MPQKNERSINWAAAAVLLSVLAMGLTGYRAVTANTLRIEALEKYANKLNQEREKDFDTLRDDLREMRQVLNSIWKEVRSK